MTRDELLKCLNDIDGLPQDHRTIYEAGYGPRLKPSGRWFVDYSASPGGTTEEVPRALIDSLESEGVLARAFPLNPHIEAWVLNDPGAPDQPNQGGEMSANHCRWCGRHIRFYANQWCHTAGGGNLCCQTVAPKETEQMATPDQPKG